MQLLLLVAALFDMHGAPGAPPPGQWSRILLIATALLGGFFSFACQAAATTTTRLGPSYRQTGAVDAFWIALLSQHFYLRSLEYRPRYFLSSSPATTYDWGRSTEDNYRATPDGGGSSKNYGRFASIRDGLDRRFHAAYTRQRQAFQDAVIESMLQGKRGHHHHHHDDDEGAVAGRNCSRSSNPWIVFTAGAMGAGKSHTVRLLDEKGRFPLHSFVTVDPDQVRHRLPEFDRYARLSPERAGEMTRKECGMMSEILTKAALARGRNVLVDGSLRNATWYGRYFRELREVHPNLRIGIIHVTAPRNEVFARAMVSFGGVDDCIVILPTIMMNC